MRAGFASCLITPPTTVSLLGYDFRQQQLQPGNDGVLDDLACRVLLLEDRDGTPAVWVTLDLCILSVGFATHIRERIAVDQGIAPERVLVSCSHTHSGPWLLEPELSHRVGQVFDHVGCLDPDGPERAYANALPDLILDTVRRAAGLTVPVALHHGAAPLGIGYDRRVPVGEGVEQCWNPQEQAHLRPAGSADPTMTLVEFRQLGGPQRFLLCSIGCHPVTLGKTSRMVSADWPGRLLQQVGELVPGCRPLFVLGACGDVHPWIATQADPAALDQVARPAAAQAALLLQALGLGVDDPDLAVREEPLASGNGSIVIWEIGPIRVVATPTELFAGLARRIREAVPMPVLMATNTNGWTGYWPASTDWPGGGYEIDAARAHGRGPQDGDELADRVVALLQG